MLGKLLKIGLLIWMALVIVGAFLYAPPAAGFRVPELARLLFFHVPNAMAATCASVASAWYALRYLMAHNLRADIKSHAASGLAMLFWLLTTITGAVFAKVQWGAYWNWDPKQSAIFVLLLIYMAYFALRSAVPDPRKAAAISAGYALFAAATVPFLTYVLPNAPGVQSLHPQGVVFSEDGMDARYKLIFWSATVGFLGLALWIFRLQVRVEEMRLDLRLRPVSPRTASAPALAGGTKP
ncbi:MAG TPA: cytochrome c biogenesis protein CcsA [Capsulimonadaceae bacterium]|nr:cytochrome c biogenesis protein CcsA [Capsulimonadaceae bacterium]